MVVLVVGHEERLALTAIDHGGHDQLGSCELSGHDMVAGDGAVIVGAAIRAPILLKALEGIALVSVRVLAPVVVVAPDAVGAVQIVTLDGLQELVYIAFASPIGPPGPGLVDGAASEKPHAYQENQQTCESAIEDLRSPAYAGGIVFWRIHQGHRLQYLRRAGSDVGFQKRLSGCPELFETRRFY